jgi:hypothetical protein
LSLGGAAGRVDGDTDRVASDLNAADREKFVQVRSGEESLYVHPAHVTHFMPAGEWEGPLVEIR